MSGFRLDAGKLIDAVADDYGDVADVSLNTISEDLGRAVELLIVMANDAGALTGSDVEDLTVIAYAMAGADSYADSVLVAVRVDGARVPAQASSLYVEVRRIVNDAYGRRGAEVLIETCEAVLAVADELIAPARAIAALGA